jgi:pimeloyl-CoA dehydrogenase small subunit
MDFDFSDEQRLLKDSVDRLVADRYEFEQRKAYAKSPEGWSRDIWAQYAELGTLGLPFAEADGGFGGTAVETMIVMEALGRALALEPYFATIVLAGGLLRHGGSDAQRKTLVPQIAEGKLTLAFAYAERRSRYDLASVETRARRDGKSWVLEGDKSLVMHGDSANQLIVSARAAGGPRDKDGIGLFIVDAKAPGVSRRGYPTQNGLRAADISLASVQVDDANVLGDGTSAYPVIERVVDEAIAALCAEAVGAMEAAHELTVEYLKTRKQFGRPIGSFQALQHQAVDMLVSLEQARSMTMYATMMAQEEDAAERHRAMLAAKVQIGRSGKFIGQKSIQLHGGVGMTMEYKVGHYFKHLTMLDIMFGDADHQLTELARLGGLMDANRDAA